LADSRPLSEKADIKPHKADVLAAPAGQIDVARRSADHRAWRPPEDIDPRPLATWLTRTWKSGRGVMAASRTALWLALPPTPFDACDKQGTRVNSLSLVRYGRKLTRIGRE